MRSLAFKVSAFLLAVSLALSGCAHFSSISSFPGEYEDRLKDGSEWLTLTVFENSFGTFPPAEISVIKRWSVSRTEDGVVRMDEIKSSSFVGLMDAVRQNRKPEQRVLIKGRIDPRAFFPFPSHALKRRRPFAPDRYQFRDIDGTRFEILINEGGRIVFFPALSRKDELPSVKNRADIGIWSAPFGPEGELLTHILNLLSSSDVKDLPAEISRGSFLHYSPQFDRQVPIVFQSGFPDRYRVSMEKSMVTWNKAYGKNHFVLGKSHKDPSLGDCLSGQMLCVKWIGSPEIPMTGTNGYTQFGFDPETGRITGGIIYVANDDVVGPLRPMADADLAKLRSQDMDWILDSTHRFSELNAVRHPEAQSYIQYLFTHELGHASGLAHNFLSGEETTPLHPSVSIMSYPPFAVAHRATYLGSEDLERLALIYNTDRARMPERYCSTFDALGPEAMSARSSRRSASCDMYILGDPAQWYIQLALRSAAGVFSQYPDLSIVSDEVQQAYRQLIDEKLLPPLNILSRLGVILGDSSKFNEKRRKKVRDFLCSDAKNLAKVSKQLKTYQGVTLDCSQR